MRKQERIAVAAVGAALLALFTFTDLAISEALFTRPVIARVFEVIGELPFAFFAVFAFALFFRFRNRQNKASSILLGGLFSLLGLLFAAMGGFMCQNYLKDNWPGAPDALAALAAAVLIAAAVLLARCVPKEQARQAVTFAIIAVVYFVAVIVVMNTIKGFWGRMRIREMTDPAVQFTRWYVLTARGGFDNTYASFPSGHAMNAAGTILLGLLPAFVPKLAGKEKLLKTAAYVWMVVIGTSRVMMGAHFASDVVAGVLLSLVLFELTRTAVCKTRKIKLLE